MCVSVLHHGSLNIHFRNFSNVYMFHWKLVIATFVPETTAFFLQKDTNLIWMLKDPGQHLAVIGSHCETTTGCRSSFSFYHKNWGFLRLFWCSVAVYNGVFTLQYLRRQNAPQALLASIQSLCPVCADLYKLPACSLTSHKCSCQWLYWAEEQPKVAWPLL